MSFRVDERSCLAPLYYGGKALTEDVSKIVRCEPAEHKDCLTTEECAGCNDNEGCQLFCGAWRVAARAVSWCLLVANAVIDCISRLFDCAPSMIPQEALQETAALSINPEKLAEIPDAVALDKDLLSDAEVEIDELTTLARNLGAPDVSGYVSLVKSKISSQKLADQDLVLYAKNFILKLKDPSIPNEKKLLNLTELLKAVGFCQSRSGNDTKKYFKKLIGADLSFEQNIRQWIQDLKEDILIEYFGDIHALDQARQTVGREWGLDVTAESLADFGAELGLLCMCTSDATFRYILHKNYTPARLVTAIHTKILSETCQDQANKYLEDQGALLPENWEVDFFDTHADGSPLNMKAVTWILQHSGYLN